MFMHDIPFNILIFWSDNIKQYNCNYDFIREISLSKEILKTSSQNSCKNSKVKGATDIEMILKYLFIGYAFYKSFVRGKACTYLGYKNFKLKLS